MKIIIFLLFILCFYPFVAVYADSEIRYMRNAQRITNGFTAGDLGTTQTSSGTYEIQTALGTLTVYWSWDVIIRHANGSQTILGSKIAQVSRASNNGGIQSANWTCPLTSLESTDAIRLSGFIKFGSGSWISIGYGDANAWITEQLNGSQLDNAVWTIYSYTRRDTWYERPYYYTDGYLYWGSETYNTRITNFSWSLQEYTLTINIGGNGTVTKNPDLATYPSGTNVTLTAIPSLNWSFANWSGDLSGSQNPTYIVMDSDKNVTATFILLEEDESYVLIGFLFVVSIPLALICVVTLRKRKF